MIKITVSQQTYIRGNSTIHVEPRAVDSDNMSAEPDHDEQSQNADHLVDISL